KALQDQDGIVRGSAARALGKIGAETADVVPALIKALEDQDATGVSGSAVEALVNIGRPALPQLIAALNERNGVVFRSGVAEAMARIRDKNAVPALIKALEDQDKVVRRTAAQALGVIGAKDADAVSGLIKAIGDDDGFVRRSAAEALGKVGAETA